MWNGNFRVRVATEREILARSFRSASLGNVFVEGEYVSRLSRVPQWELVSSHLTEEAANKAMAKLVRKHNRGG